MTDLPEWNDLPEATRTALCEEGRFWEHANGGDAAHAIYGKIRELLATNGGEAVARRFRPRGYSIDWAYAEEAPDDPSGFDVEPLYASPVSIPQDGTSGVRVTDDLVSIIAHGIADAQGDAYAEYSSEFDGYAKAALFALKKNLCGFSTNGVNVWATPDDIKTVMDWQHSHSVVDDLRTHVRHWREGYGKLEGHRREMLDVLKRAIAVWDAEVFDEAAADAVLKSAIETVTKLEPLP